MNDKRRVLAIDDSRSILIALSIVFRTMPDVEFRTRDHTLGGTETSEILSFNPHLIILDLEIPLIGGARFIPMLRSMGWKGSIFIYSSESAETIMRVVSQEGAIGWQRKGGTLAEVGERIKSVLSNMPVSSSPLVGA
jgi:DNA-binding NarL/FixJ family response regulator